MSTAKERRIHQRIPLTTSIQFQHDPSQRAFPARCVDISAGGLRMYVPATTPVQPGHTVRLDTMGLNRPDVPATEADTVLATVVRVDRRSLLSAGNLAIAVRFDNSFASH